jgi:hypothetical protein
MAEVKKCKLWWCPEGHYAEGLCTRHYRSKRRWGEVRLGSDARALYAHIQRTQVLLTGIVEHCWRESGGFRLCRHCHAPEHDPNCIVLTAQSLLVESQ